MTEVVHHKEICHCCGFEFGFDDLDQNISLKRKKWFNDGANGSL
jgi:hypothetical protein